MAVRMMLPHMPLNSGCGVRCSLLSADSEQADIYHNLKGVQGTFLSHFCGLESEEPN